LIDWNSFFFILFIYSFLCFLFFWILWINIYIYIYIYIKRTLQTNDRKYFYLKKNKNSGWLSAPCLDTITINHFVNQEYLGVLTNTYDMTHKTCARLAFAFCKYIFLFGFVSLVLYVDLVKVSDRSMICSILSEKKIGRVVHACCIISESGLEHSFLTP